MRKNKKKIVQLDFNFNIINTFDSIEETAKEHKVSRANISGCAARRGIQVKGYYFTLEQDIEDFKKYVTDNFKVKCKICNLLVKNERSLATHLQTSHSVETKEYTVNYILNGSMPKCKHLNCNNEPRYVSFSFKDYCKEHALIAMSIGGKIGAEMTNEDGAWNKGLTKFNDNRIKIQAENMLGEKNHFYGKKHSDQFKEYLKKESTLSREEFYKRIDKRKEEFELLSSYDEYSKHPKSRQSFYLELLCKKCNKKSKKTLSSYERGFLCATCFPCGKSKEELELYNFIKDFLVKNKNYNEYDIINGDRQTIKPKELDVFIKPNKFAIEYNGLYWHGEHEHLNKVDKRTIQEKTDLCDQQGIQLFHIYSDEWIDNKQLVKSMILSKLGHSTNKIYARKLKIKEISNQEAKSFFESSHLSGHVKSEKIYALIDEHSTIMCAISFRKPYHKKYENYIEIARFATIQGHQIIGGFTKLLAHSIIWIKQNGYENILSYCDLRHGNGKVYDVAGFVNKGCSDISYWYTDGIKRYNRFKFRADKQNGKTENDVAKENNVWKIYGCRNKIYEYKVE